MKRWKKIALISSGTILLLFFATLSAFNYFSLKMVELHQKSVTRSIAAWGDEYSQIHSEGDAHEAVEMMEYISRYYATPHPGYKGTTTSEKNLEEQRATTLARIAAAVEKFRSANRLTNNAAPQRQSFTEFATGR